MNRVFGNFDLVKAVYFISFLTVFILAYLLLMLIPHLKEYRMLNGRYEQSEKVLVQGEKELAAVQTSLKLLKDQNGPSLAMLEAPFDPKAVVRLAPSQSGMTVSDKVGSDASGEFTIEEYDIAMTLGSPAQFYEFARDLTKKAAIGRIGGMLVMQRGNEGGVHVEFPLFVYRTNDGAHKKITPLPASTEESNRTKPPASEESSSAHHETAGHSPRH